MRKVARARSVVGQRANGAGVELRGGRRSGTLEDRGHHLVLIALPQGPVRLLRGGNDIITTCLSWESAFACTLV